MLTRAHWLSLQSGCTTTEYSLLSGQNVAGRVEGGKQVSLWMLRCQGPGPIDSRIGFHSPNWQVAQEPRKKVCRPIPYPEPCRILKPAPLETWFPKKPDPACGKSYHHHHHQCCAVHIIQWFCIVILSWLPEMLAQ